MGKTRPLSVYFCSFHNSIANIHDVNGKNVDVVLGIWTPGQPLTPTSTHCAKEPMTVCDDFQLEIVTPSIVIQQPNQESDGKIIPPIFGRIITMKITVLPK